MSIGHLKIWQCLCLKFEVDFYLQNRNSSRKLFRHLLGAMHRVGEVPYKRIELNLLNLLLIKKMRAILICLLVYIRAEIKLCGTNHNQNEGTIEDDLLVNELQFIKNTFFLIFWKIKSINIFRYNFLLL